MNKIIFFICCMLYFNCEYTIASEKEKAQITLAEFSIDHCYKQRLISECSATADRLEDGSLSVKEGQSKQDCVNRLRDPYGDAMQRVFVRRKLDPDYVAVKQVMIHMMSMSELIKDITTLNSMIDSEINDK